MTDGAKFFRKIFILGKKLKNSSRIGFFDFSQKFNLLTCLFYLKNGE